MLEILKKDPKKDANSRVYDLVSEQTALMARLDRATNELKDQKSAASELKALWEDARRTDRLNEANANQGTLITNLQKTTSELLDTKSDLFAAREVNAEIKAFLDQTKLRNTELEKEVRTKTDELSKIQYEVQSNRSNIDELKANLAFSRETMSNADRDLRDAREKLSVSQSRVSDLEHEVRNMMPQLQSGGSELTAMKVNS